MKTAETTSRIAVPGSRRTYARALVIAGAIVALAAPASTAAKTIPRKAPVPHVAGKTSLPAKPVTHVVKRAIPPRVLLIRVWWPVDMAKVQAEADFAALYERKMLARGLESWDWPNDPTAVAVFNAGINAIRAGTKTVDQILTEVDSTW